MSMNIDAIAPTKSLNQFQDINQFKERFKTIGRKYRKDVIDARQTRTLPQGLWTNLAEEGLFSIVTSQSYGYLQGVVLLSAALESLSYGILDGGVAISLISQIGLCISTLDRYASEHVRNKYLDRLTSGREVAAFAITEPQGGSDALHSKSELTPKDDGTYTLSGEKWHITNAPIASVIITFAREKNTNDFFAVLVDANWSGVEVSQPLKPAGLRGSPVGSISFREVSVPETHILGKNIEGKNILNNAFLMERILSPFPMIGIVQHLIEKVLSYSTSRKVFGQPIGNNQHIQRRITDMKIGLDTLDALANSTLQKFSEGQNISLEASLGKMYGARILMEAGINAAQIYGSYGIQEGTGFTEALLDGISATIAGGTEEVHRSVIYGQMLLQYRRSRYRSNKKKVNL